MPITISFDNNPDVDGIQKLLEDESKDPQVTGTTTDDGNEVDVTLTSGDLAGFGTAFDTLLDTLNVGATREQYAADHDGASSVSTFVSVSTDGETVDNLFFSDGSGAALDGDEVVGVTTLAGKKIFLYSDGSHGSTEDFCVAVNEDGFVVAAFYLNEDTTDHLSAQIQMVTFEPLKHAQSGNDHDDPIDWTNVLNVSASGSLHFDFDNLRSGNFLWVAIGSSAGGLLVTGQDLNVNDTNSGKHGKMITGGDDPCDTVNTSQGGINATIGINSQHFVDGAQGAAGPVGVFTLVTDYGKLATAEQATGIDVDDIQYGGYINTNSASVFISQVTGGSDTRMLISLWEAGGNGVDMEPGDLTPEEGWSDPTVDSPYSYIGNQDSTGSTANLFDDVAVDVETVKIGNLEWDSSNSGDPQGGITVTIDGNDITIEGNVPAGTTIEFFAADDPLVDEDGTFNRFTIQALGDSGAFDIGAIDIDNVIGDTKAVGGNLVVEDDGPKFTGSISGGRVDFNGPILSLTGSLLGAVGTDTNTSPYIFNSYTASISFNGITLTAVPNSTTAPTVVTYYQNTNGDNVIGNTGDLDFFRISLDQTANQGAGGYLFEVLRGPPVVEVSFGFADLPAGQNLFGIVATNKTNIADTGTQENPHVRSDDILPDGGLLVVNAGVVYNADGHTYDTNDSSTVNTSKVQGVSIGYKNQNYSAAGEDAFFIFVDDPAYNAVGSLGLTQTTADDADTLRFNGSNEVFSASVEIVKIVSGATAGVTIRAYDLDDGQLNVDTNDEARALLENPLTFGTNDPQSIDINAVRVYNSVTSLIDSGPNATLVYSAVDTNNDGVFSVSETLVDTGEVSVTLNTVTGTINSVTVNSMDSEHNYTVRYDTAALHDMSNVMYQSGSYNIGGFNLIQSLPFPDRTLSFQAKVTDGDTDFALSNTWTIGIDGTGIYDNDTII